MHTPIQSRDFQDEARSAAEAKSKRERIRRSADVKQRISDGMLLNWHQEPHRRLAVSEKLKVRSQQWHDLTSK